MASAFAKSGKMKRMESKKSHSWWWDSHIAPKNKWLHDNLEEMDDLVKKMLKLIEEDADSFAKKAELYFKKRPELINIVEEFYRMYRALAERYDIVSGELRKATPADLQSQGSGMSDAASDLTAESPSPNRRPARSASGPRAAGFDVFLGGGSEGNSKGDDGSTLDSESSDSESKSNDSSQSHGDENGMQWRVLELETELESLKEQLKMQKEETCENCKKHSYESFEASKKIAEYEEDLRVVKEKFQQSEEEITRLSMELQKCASDKEFESTATAETNGLTVEVLDSLKNIQILEEDLRSAREKILTSEDEVAGLKQELVTMEGQLKSARGEVSDWKEKFERENDEISNLQDRITRYKTSLIERDQEIRSLREAMTNANKSLAEENERLRAEITRMTKERTYLEDRLKEIELRCQSLEEELRRTVAANGETEARFGDEIQQLKAKIADRDNRVEEANGMLEGLKIIRDDLSNKITALNTEISSKDDHIAQTGSHLHQLHMQHVGLIAAAEGARKQAEELQTRVRELEIEVQRKLEIINEGAEGKREAIRQLCFSLDHYRSGFHQLRQAIIEHRRQTVIAN